MLGTELGRSNSVALFKYPIEIAQVIQTNFVANINYGSIGVEEQVCGVGESQVVDVLGRSAAEQSPAGSAEVLRAGMRQSLHPLHPTAEVGWVLHLGT